jgi:predicted nucleic-acid-binding protein
MQSIDTNVILRAILDDDRVQTPIARDVMSRECFVAPTVLIEAVWTMRSKARLDQREIALQIGELLTLPNIVFGERQAVEWAVATATDRCDFADMLHVALSRAADSFATFDRGIARCCGAAGLAIETLDA